jgi:hypothetical protein
VYVEGRPTMLADRLYLATIIGLFAVLAVVIQLVAR